MKRITGIVIIVALALAPDGGARRLRPQDQAVEQTTGHIDMAKDVAAKGEIMMVKTGVPAYMATNGARAARRGAGRSASFVEPVAQEPVDPGADEGRATAGRHRLRARDRHELHARRRALRRQRLQRAVTGH